MGEQGAGGGGWGVGTERQKQPVDAMGARAVKADFVAESVLIKVRSSSGDTVTVVRRFSSTMTTSRHGRSLHVKSSLFFGGCDALPSEDAPHRQPVGRCRARRDGQARTEMGGYNGECRHRPAGAGEHPRGYRGAPEAPRAPRWGRRRHTRRRHRRRRLTAPGRRRGAGRPRVGGIHDGGGGGTAAAPAVIAPRLRDKRRTRREGGAGTHWATR